MAHERNHPIANSEISGDPKAIVRILSDEHAKREEQWWDDLAGHGLRGAGGAARILGDPLLVGAVAWVRIIACMAGFGFRFQHFSTNMKKLRSASPLQETDNASVATRTFSGDDNASVATQDLLRPLPLSWNIEYFLRSLPVAVCGSSSTKTKASGKTLREEIA